MVSMRWLQRNIRPEQRGQLVDWRGVHAAFRAVATAVVRNPREAEDLVLFYGSPDYQPTGGVVLMIPGQSPIYVSQHQRVQGDNPDPVWLTALQLRDLVTDLWWSVIADVLNDPDQGHFTIESLRAKPEQLQFRALEMNRLGRILADSKNKVLNPDRQFWQDTTVQVTT